jgi:hypothetical protein
MNTNSPSFPHGASRRPSDLELATRSPQAGDPPTPPLDPAFAEMDALFQPSRLAWLCGSIVTSRRMAESA